MVDLGGFCRMAVRECSACSALATISHLVLSISKVDGRVRAHTNTATQREYCRQLGVHSHKHELFRAWFRAALKGGGINAPLTTLFDTASIHTYHNHY